VIPRTLAENAGLEATLVLSQLYAKHEAGEVSIGVNVDVRSPLLFLLPGFRVSTASAGYDSEIDA
jgi:hypothetical protein